MSSELGRPRSAPPPSARQQILRAALEEFAACGFDGATTARIAENAGVTQPLVHHHFGTKLDLWKAAVDEVFAELENLQGPLLEASAGLEAGVRVRLLVRQLILHTIRRPALVRILVLESGRESERAHYLIDHHMRPFARRFQELLDEAVSDGMVRSVDTRLVSLLGMGAASYLSIVPVQAKRLFKLDVTDPAIGERYADLVVEVLLHGVKNDGGEPPADSKRKR